MTVLGRVTVCIFLALLFIHSYGQTEEFVSDSIKARALNRTANEFGRKGMHIQALEYYYASLELRKKVYGDFSKELAPVYVGIGITYRMLGQLNQSLFYFDLAEKCYSEKDVRKIRIARLYVNIGNVYREKLDFKNALSYYNQAIAVFEMDNAFSQNDIAGVFYNIAEIYYLTNEYDKALNIINDNIENAYAEDQILYYELLAFINQIKGNTIKADQSYQHAIDLTKYLYFDKPIYIAIEYLNYSNFLISKQLFAEASEMLKKAEAILLKVQPNEGESLSTFYLLTGDLLMLKPFESNKLASFKKQKISNIKEAISNYQKGLSALRFQAGVENNDAIDTKNTLSLMGVIRILKKLGDSFLYLNDLEENTDDGLTEALDYAMKHYQTASTLIQKARKEISSDESKLQLSELEYSTFLTLIRAAYEAYNCTNDPKYIDLAFLNTEKTKSSVLYDNISDHLAQQNSLIPDSLRDLEAKLNNTINILPNRIYEESSKALPDSTLIAALNNELFEATRNREELNTFLENNYNNYYELKYSNKMLSIKDIQHRLDDNQVILEYALNETDTVCELYTFIISNQTIDFDFKKLDNKFNKNIKTVYNYISNVDFLYTTNNDTKQFCQSAYSLYHELFHPYLKAVQNKNVIIIPDGSLSYIPFDALISSLPDTTRLIRLEQLNYLIRDFTFNYANSANLLFQKRNNRKHKKVNVLAVAPDYDGEKFVVGNNQMVLMPLPGVEEEVRNIGKKLKSKMLLNHEGTEKNFRAYAENYDILHLAMHAFINDSMPALSSLAFKQVDTNNTYADGRLSTADIYNLKLNARLTVLSACNTGLGLNQRGEGILSLARGFLYAGCPAIVMSLWEVEDESGTSIMTSFYSYLKSGKTKDEALRKAKLDYLASAGSRKAHPHYWLSFVNIGDNSALYFSYDYYFFILLILAIAGIGLDQFFRIKKARKKQAS